MCSIIYSFKNSLKQEERNSGPLSDKILVGILGKFGRILFLKTLVTVDDVLFRTGIADSHFEQWSIATTTARFPLEVLGSTMTSTANNSNG